MLAKFVPKGRWCWQFFWRSGAVYQKYLRQGWIRLTKLKFLNICRMLFCRKGQKCGGVVICFFLHDNAPAHSALRTHQFLAKHSIIILSHQPYLPNLAPSNFFLFPTLKRTLKRKEKDLKQFPRIRQIWPRSWRTSQKKHSRTVSKSEKQLEYKSFGGMSSLKET